MTAVDSSVVTVVVMAGLLGAVVGYLVDRAAARFPWPASRRSGGSDGEPPPSDRMPPPRPPSRSMVAVRGPVVQVGTAVLFALTGLRFGLSWELPAFLFLAAVGVLLALIDLRHHLLPNRVVVPSIGIGAVLLLVAALFDRDADALLRSASGAGALFAGFLALALISPSGLGMGDVKLAALVGLYLGWIGWGAVLVGAVAGFVLQAFLAVLLLAGRRIGLRGELPFGPAMLLGVAVAIGWSDALLA